MSEIVSIQSRDYWFKVVDMLQQNWALADEMPGGVTVFFFGDTSEVFDEMRFDSAETAESALRINGFRRLTEGADAKLFLRSPEPPFIRRPHPNGPIYSSGRYWRSA